MAIEVKMPKLSDTMEEGTILRWFKRPGEQVKQGEPLAEVETDKADMELEAESNGVLTEIRVAEGEAASVGTVLAVLDGAANEPAGQTPGAPAATPSPSPPARESKPSAAPAAPARDTKPPAPARTPSAAPPPPSSRPRATTGEAPRSGARNEPTSNAESAPPSPEAVRRPEVSKLRATVAKQMTSSKREVPHFYVTAEIDMSEAARMRAALADSDAFPERITFTHLLVRALVLTLQRHPRVNATWNDGAIVYHEDVNIGVAVAVEDGLIAPVVRRCQEMTLRQIARAVSDLVGKAQAGKFSGDALSGATFTLSNLGMLDIEEFSAVITQPQAAILAVGAIKDRAVVRDAQLVIAKTMRVTLSCDHRVLNGMEAGRFLEDLKRTLENPVRLVIGAE